MQGPRTDSLYKSRIDHLIPVPEGSQVKSQIPGNTQDDVDDEPIGALDGILERETVIDLKDTRLCRVRTVLAHLDETPRLDFEDSEIEIENPIRVMADDRNIGWATVALNGYRLVADLALEFSSPERFVIETGSEDLYARVSGALQFKLDDGADTGVLDLYGSKRSVRRLLVESIVITRDRGLDPDLEPLGKAFL